MVLKDEDTTTSTYIDDAYVLAKSNGDIPLSTLVVNKMSQLESYMAANKMKLNSDKSQVLVVSKNKITRETFRVFLDNKEIKHSDEVVILGNKISSDLSWDRHVESVLIPSLNNKLRSLRLVANYLSYGFRPRYIGSIIQGSLSFAAENWAGVHLRLIRKLEGIQKSAAKLALGFKFRNWSTDMRLRHLKWLSIKDLGLYATITTTHKLIHKQCPMGLSEKMTLNTTGPRIALQLKLATKPRILTSTYLRKQSLRARAYQYNLVPGPITRLTRHDKFKKYLKRYINNKQDKASWTPDTKDYK